MIFNVTVDCLFQNKKWIYLYSNSIKKKNVLSKYKIQDLLIVLAICMYLQCAKNETTTSNPIYD